MILMENVAGSPQGMAELFEELYDPAFLIDPERGRFVGANAAACSFLGYGSEEFTALTPADIHPHEIPRLDAFLNAVTRHRRWSTDELSCRSKEGAFIPAQVRATLVRIGDRALILAVVRDRREEQLAELGRSIRKLTHDLRNTMVASRLMGDRLCHHDDPLVRRSAELITRSVDRAVRMCESALEAGTSTEHYPQRERFALNDVIVEIAAAIAPEEVASTRLQAPGAENVLVDADYDQVFRMLLNLIRNAVVAGARRVTVTGREEGNTTIIDVADNGPGLPDEVRKRLFSEKPQSSRGRGAGLGLAIAWELARNHGGDVHLLETGPGGTTFRIRLPHHAVADAGEAPGNTG